MFDPHHKPSPEDPETLEDGIIECKIEDGRTGLYYAYDGVLTKFKNNSIHGLHWSHQHFDLTDYRRLVYADEVAAEIRRCLDEEIQSWFCLTTVMAVFSRLADRLEAKQNEAPTDHSAGA